MKTEDEGSSQCGYTSTKLHDITFQEAVIYQAQASKWVNKIKMDLKRMWSEFIWLRIGLNAKLCKQGNASLGSKKVRSISTT
jgi:hypothetical protein